MRSLALLIFAAALMAAPAFAEEAAPLPETANEQAIVTALATVVAGEKTCGLSYDQAAIAAYVEYALPANSSNFPATFNYQVSAARDGMSAMSGSQKTVFCTQVRRLAEHMAITN